MWYSCGVANSLDVLMLVWCVDVGVLMLVWCVDVVEWGEVASLVYS